MKNFKALLVAGLVALLGASVAMTTLAQPPRSTSETTPPVDKTGQQDSQL